MNTNNFADFVWVGITSAVFDDDLLRQPSAVFDGPFSSSTEIITFRETQECLWNSCETDAGPREMMGRTHGKRKGYSWLKLYTPEV